MIGGTGSSTLAPLVAPQTVTAPWRDGGPIDARYTCKGANVSPALSWTAAPEGTQEIAITLIDQDASFEMNEPDQYALEVSLLLAITVENALLDTHPGLARSIRNRFPYLDPLNHVQIKLLKAHRAQDPDPQVLRGIQLTINGIDELRSTTQPSPRLKSPARSPAADLSASSRQTPMMLTSSLAS